MAFLENGKIVFLRQFVSFDEVNFATWFENTSIHQIIIASVIDIPPSFLKHLQDIAPLKVIKNSDFRPNIQQAEYSIDSLGIDRKLLVLGAQVICKKQDCLVIALGSCITYTIISANKEIKGGVISPGLEMRARSMHQFTEKLPYVNWRDMNLAGTFGLQTEQNLWHGILTATKFEINGFIAEFLRTNPKGKVVFTGGDAMYIQPDFVNKNYIFEQNLLWIGMQELS